MLFGETSRVAVTSSGIVRRFGAYCRGDSFLSGVILYHFKLRPLRDLVSVLEDNTGTEVDGSGVKLYTSGVMVAVKCGTDELRRRVSVVRGVRQSPLLSPFRSGMRFLLPMACPRSTRCVNVVGGAILGSGFRCGMVRRFLSSRSVTRLEITSSVFVRLRPASVLSKSVLRRLDTRGVIVANS